MLYYIIVYGLVYLIFICYCLLPLSLLLHSILVWLVNDNYQILVLIKLIVFNLLNKLYFPLMLLYFYFNIGLITTIISIKLIVSITIIVSNIIDIYFIGIIIVLVYYLLLSITHGLVLFTYLLLYFLTKIEIIIILLFMSELFSTFFQSLTLANRLSINLLAGSLFITLIVIALRLLFISFIEILVLLLPLIIFIYELFNLLIQVFIFNILSIEYSVSNNI